jgi:hypothetical protein
MTVPKPSMSDALLKTKEPPKRKPEKIYNAAATPGRRGKRGLTIYLDPVAHADLKDLLKEGVNLVLQRYGKKPIA